MISDEVMRELRHIEKEIEILKIFEVPKASSGWVYLQAPLTSTSWDGDAHSTTAKTLIDLSTVFGVPPGVKAVLVKVAANDSGSAGTSCFIALSPNNTAFEYALVCKPFDIANDSPRHANGVVPCDNNGDIYYEIAATGVNTFDVILQIWGWELP
jgi:hypothetical protein